MADEDEVRLSGGFSNVESRRGDTIRRNAGPWTPTVHALLRHLRASGFTLALEPLGFDDQGREVLGFIEGQAAWWPWHTGMGRSQGRVVLRSPATAHRRPHGRTLVHLR